MELLSEKLPRPKKKIVATFNRPYTWGEPDSRVSMRKKKSVGVSIMHPILRQKEDLTSLPSPLRASSQEKILEKFPHIFLAQVPFPQQSFIHKC